MCALTGADRVGDALKRARQAREEQHQMPGAPSAPNAAAPTAPPRSLEQLERDAERAAAELLAEEEREAAQRQKKGPGAKKKPQKHKKKAAPVTARKASHAIANEEDGGGDGDDEADDDASLAVALQRTVSGVAPKKAPSLLDTARLNGKTLPPTPAGPSGQPRRSRPLAEVLANAAGESQLSAAPGPAEAAPARADVYAVTQLFPWMRVDAASDLPPPAPLPPAAVETPYDDDCCIVCLDMRSTVVLGPRCAHPPVLCELCADALMEKNAQALCPLCRMPA